LPLTQNVAKKTRCAKKLEQTQETLKVLPASPGVVGVGLVDKAQGCRHE